MNIEISCLVTVLSLFMCVLFYGNSQYWKAKEVKAIHGPLKGRLCVDNPGEPLTVWKDQVTR